MDATEIVAYYRVSTKMQGIQGLGMEAQRRSVEAYAMARCLPIVAAYAEVETGRKDDLRNRPKLVSAVAHARRSGALLVIARIDRLARSVFVTAQLLKSNVEFVACDNPHANRLTIQILAVMAEHEGRLISERTKAGLEAARARGVKFGGGHALTAEHRRKGREAAWVANRKKARDAYADLVPRITALRASGETMTAIALTLNDAGHCTQRRNPWTISCVRRLLVREDILSRYPVDLRRNNITTEIQRLGAEASGVEARSRARAAYANIVPMVLGAYASGASLREIARTLNGLGHRTQAWGLWTGTSVRHLIEREGVELRPRLDNYLTPEVIRAGIVAAAKARRERSQAHFEQIAPLARSLRDRGRTLQGVADELNRRGRRTSRGMPWSESLVWLLLHRSHPPSN